MCLACQVPSHVSRRRFLTWSATAIAAGSLGSGALAQYSETSPAPNAISPDDALKRIMEGNARYVANAPSNKDFSSGRAARAAAQYPIAGIISCADARLAPELAFDQGPGELFVVRVAGNFVNDDGLASLEYGVKFLGIPLVMVLGHTGCGAVSATIKVVEENAVLPGHLPELVNSIKPAIELAKKTNPPNLLVAATIENVRYNRDRLTSSDPILGEFVRQGKLKVVGGVYDIASGRVNMI